MSLRPARRQGGIPVVGSPGELSAARLLELPLRLHGIPLGHPVDLVLELESLRVIGLEVRCGDEALRYLPLAAAGVRDDEIAIASALVLFDERDLAWYRRRATSLRSVRGAPVRHEGRQAGALADVILAGDGRITALLVEAGGQVRRLRVGAGTAIARPGNASAA